MMKPVGKPDAVIPHVRFDERRLETELRRELRHRHRRKQPETVQPRSLRPPRQSPTLLARWLRERGVEAYVIHPSSIADELFMLAIWPFCVFLFDRRDRRHAAVAPFTPQPAQKCAHQQFGIETVGLGAPMFTGHGDARRVDDIGLNAPLSKPARQ